MSPRPPAPASVLLSARPSPWRPGQLSRLRSMWAGASRRRRAAPAPRHRGTTRRAKQGRRTFRRLVASPRECALSGRAALHAWCWTIIPPVERDLAGLRGVFRVVGDFCVAGGVLRPLSGGRGRCDHRRPRFGCIHFGVPLLVAPSPDDALHRDSGAHEGDAGHGRPRFLARPCAVHQRAADRS